MTTIWGRLERIAEGRPEDRWVQVGTVVPGNGVILARIIIGEQTLITRGIEQVALSNLREGEFVEVTFRAARTGLVKAETIYAQPEPVMSASTCPSSVSPHMNSQSSMLQAIGDHESVCCSDQPSMNTGSSALDDTFLMFMSQPLRSEARDSVEANTRLRE
jgi:hypothetical protein